MPEKTPEPPRPLGQLTTAELSEYEMKLRETLESDNADIDTLADRFADLAAERKSRESIRVYKTWPIYLPGSG